MKLSGFIIIATSFHLLAAESYSQTTKINVDTECSTVLQVLNSIEQQSEFYFLYSTKLVDVDREVSLNYQDVLINDVLAGLFKGTDVDFLVMDKQIVLSNKELLGKTPPADKPQQGRTITGTVTDQNGEPLTGVTIQIKGTNIGTITDADGKYSLSSVPENAVLVFSFVGMKTVEMQIGSQNIINMVMKEELFGIEEVVAIGYGSQIRKNLSSSISKVSGEELAAMPVPSFEAAIQGRVPGVQVTTSSALAGSAVRVRIRGTSSVSANTEPLYILDGMPLESGAISSNQPFTAARDWTLQVAANTNALASLNPADIESIEILKDAAAAAIYGSRGANGVVLINTKRGRSGQTRVNATVNIGVSDATHVPEFLNAEQYIELAQEAWVNSGNDISTFWTNSGVLRYGNTEAQAKATDTDWTGETLRLGSKQDYNVGVSGGTDKSIFYLSFNYLDEKTILKGNHYKRYGTRLNLEHSISDRFRVGGRMMIAHVDDKQVPTSWAGGAGQASQWLPIEPVYREDGTYFGRNPVAQIDYYDILLKNTQFVGNWFLNAKIIEGLSFRTEFGVNLLNNDDFHYKNTSADPTGRAVSGTLIGAKTSWDWKNILNYNRRFGNNHNLDVVLATEAQKTTDKENAILGDGYFNSEMRKPIDAENNKIMYSENGYSFLSYIGRINYDLMGRYLLSVSVRMDGSSRFGPENRWGFFPAASLGYILSEEEYFTPLTGVVNFLKIRASYGIVGNAEMGNYRFYSTYTTRNYDGNTGIHVENIGDDQLGWEETAQLNAGLSFQLLDGRFSGELDYYIKTTTDLLLGWPVSRFTGVTSVTKNIGELENKGIELQLTSQNIITDDFLWETTFTAGQNKNEVTSLGEAEGLVGEEAKASQTALFLGYPIGTILISEWGGVDPATGEDTYYDLDGNLLTISEINDQYGNFNAFDNVNRKPMGKPYPTWMGGLNNRLSYKNWEFSFLFNFAYDLEFLSSEATRWNGAFSGSKTNVPVEWMDRWQQPGDETDIHKLTTANINWRRTSQYLHRVDYIRLRDVTLAYNLNFSGDAFIRGMRISLKATNALTFTKAPGYYWDPEYVPVNAGNLGGLESHYTAPQAKMFTLGISLSL